VKNAIDFFNEKKGKFILADLRALQEDARADAFITARKVIIDIFEKQTSDPLFSELQRVLVTSITDLSGRLKTIK
jgi:hypothetical protein